MRSKSGEFFGTYSGVVVSNADPLQLGRVKVRCPLIHGAQSSEAGLVADDDLPWALPSAQAAGGTPESGAVSWIPVTGDQVWIRFLDGELDKPIWEWGNQNLKQPQKSVHAYEADGTAQRRAVITRYGNTIEIVPERVTVTTKEGYQLRLEGSKSTSGGEAILQTPKGQSFRLNDVSQTAVLQALDGAVVSAKKVILNAPTSTLVKTTRFTLMVGSSLVAIQENSISITTASGANLVVDATGNVSITSADGSTVSVEQGKIQIGTADGTGVVIEPGKLSFNAAQIAFNSAAFTVGTLMGYPVLLLTPQMLKWLTEHTHTNGNDGAPTGPPVPSQDDPEFPLSAISQRTRMT